MNASAVKPRLLWADLIKTNAIFSVVLIHAMAMDLGKALPMMNVDSFLRVIIYIIAKVGVPLFYMANGFFLLSKQDESLEDFFKKRVLKVFLILFVWSLIFSFWKMVIGSERISFVHELRQMFNGTYYHLWFLAILLRIMLFVPIMRKVVKVSSETFLFYTAALCFFWPTAIIFTKCLTGGESDMSRTVFVGYFGYYLLGYVLGNGNVTRRLAGFAWFSAGVSLLASVAGMYYLSAVHSPSARVLINSLSPNIVVLAVSLFILLKERLKDCNNGVVSNRVAKIGQMTLGIYLVHVIFLDLGGRLVFFNVLRQSLLGLMVAALLILLVSEIFVLFVRRVPVLNKILMV